MADKGDAQTPTGFLGAVENKRNRIIACVVLSLLLATDLVLAGVALHQTPKGVDPFLAVQALLSIFTFIVCVVFLWHPLSDFSKNMARFYFGMNIFLSVIWGVAALALAISIVHNSENDNQKRGMASVRAAAAATPTATPKKHHEDYGCLLLGVTFSALFVFNAIYVHTRFRKLYPSYEGLDDGHAFSSRMDEDHDDENIQLKDNTGISYYEVSPSPGRVEMLSPDHDSGYFPEGAEHQPFRHEGENLQYQSTEYQLPNHQSQPQMNGEAYAPQNTEYRPPVHGDAYASARTDYYLPSLSPGHNAYNDSRYSGQNR